jgi:hypothetical protein
MMTREEALDKAAECLKEAEGSMSDQHWQKNITLAQLYMTLANETGRIPHIS